MYLHPSSHSNSTASRLLLFTLPCLTFFKGSILISLVKRLRKLTAPFSTVSKNVALHYTFRLSEVQTSNSFGLMYFNFNVFLFQCRSVCVRPYLNLPSLTSFLYNMLNVLRRRVDQNFCQKICK